MSLHEFPDDIRSLLVTLPYRVGLYISMSDQTGGEASDAAEMQALGNVVTYYVEDFCKSEFAQGVMLETLRRQNDWPVWKADIQSVPQECDSVFNFLTGKIDPKEILAFKNNLLEIAIAVAVAYREYDTSQNWFERFRVYLNVLLDRLRMVLSGGDAQSIDQLLNISRHEKAAINLLATTLGIKHKVG